MLKSEKVIIGLMVILILGIGYKLTRINHSTKIESGFVSSLFSKITDDNYMEKYDIYRFKIDELIKADIMDKASYSTLIVATQRLSDADPGNHHYPFLVDLWNKDKVLFDNLLASNKELSQDQKEEIQFTLKAIAMSESQAEQSE